MYDIWRICIKYFNIPGLSRQPYFERLGKVIWSKCCLLHNERFIRIQFLKSFISAYPNKSELIDTIGRQYNIAFKGQLEFISDSDMHDVLAVAFFLRVKLLNLVLTFFNLILDYQLPGEEKFSLGIETNYMGDNQGQQTDNRLNFSLFFQAIDLLLPKADRFKLWDFTFTISESLYLMQKLIDYTAIPNQASKSIYNLIDRIIDIDTTLKAKHKIELYHFGVEEPKWRLGKPGNYLKNVFHTLEILPTSDTIELSLVGILDKIFKNYKLETNAHLIFDAVLYQSFLVVLSRVEVQMMDLSFIEVIFQLFEKQKKNFQTNTNVLFQLIFLKRLVVYCFEEYDIFDKPSVANFYNSFSYKFDEYLNMISVHKLHAQVKKIQDQKNVLLVHSIKNGKAIKILEEQIKKLAEDDSKLREQLTLPRDIDFDQVYEENITYLKCITILVYEILILSFKFNKFIKKIDTVDIG
jgi:hypothetical protein